MRNDGIARLVLAGVFIRGCIALTAADATQRGFEVMLIDDAIGHGNNPDVRAPFFDWLVKDYEIECLTTAEFVHSRFNAPH